ncbi:MAG: hypothetical protein IKR59_10185 [Lachnospiraceae bacterium]|nr:hypothetical protein [Lachnospiraceae bacterium]
MPSEKNSKVFGLISLIVGAVSLLPQGITLLMSFWLIPISFIAGTTIPGAYSEFFASEFMTAAVVIGIILGLAAVAFAVVGLIRKEKKVLPLIGLIFGGISVLAGVIELLAAYI